MQAELAQLGRAREAAAACAAAAQLGCSEGVHRMQARTCCEHTAHAAVPGRAGARQQVCRVKRCAAAPSDAGTAAIGVLPGAMWGGHARGEDRVDALQRAARGGSPHWALPHVPSLAYEDVRSLPAQVAHALADGAAALQAAAREGRMDRRTGKALSAAMDHILRQLRFLALVPPA